MGTHRTLRSALPLAALMLVGACARPAGADVPAPPALTLDQLLDNMETARLKLAASAHKTFRAHVHKTREIKALDETERFTGTIDFKFPRLLKLYLKDEEKGRETIFFVGKRYGWIYRVQQKQAERGELPDPDKEKRSANPLEYGLSRSIHGLRETYLLQMQQPEHVAGAEAVPLILIPRAGEGYDVGRVIFWIDTSRWLPVQVREFKSNNEIIETHTFTQIETDKPIEDAVFEFKLPPGVDEIIHDAP